ncbi:efflux transporter outer membrane subunit [Vreelandella boliviensis]|nr:efflux transporter outer membrane subunit [Halomonas boliviensis]
MKKEKAARLATMLLVLGLSGCTSLAPPHSTPEAALPDAYSNQVAPTTVADADNGWRSYFTDTRLQALIEQALTTNYDLRSALLRVEQARAAYGIQRAERLPTLGVEAAGERSRTPADLSPSGRTRIGNQFQAGVGFSTWELDFWGRVRNLNEAALEQYLATDEARRATEISLIAQVADSYFRLQELDERLDLARRTIDSRQESLRIFTRRVEVGATSPLELTQVEMLLQQAKALGAQLEQAYAQQANALALLVGSPIETVAGDEHKIAADALAPLAPGLPSELLIRRPDIRSAEHLLRSANANIGAARAAFFPRIALTGNLGTASADLGGLLGSDSQAWNFSPTLSLPIFDSGRRRANLTLAELRREQAVVEYEQTIQQAFRDVADALAANRWLAEQLETASAMLAVQRERTRLAMLRYESGAVPYLEVLDAQRDLLSAEQQRVEKRRQLLSARVALYTALGGGLI